MAGAQRRPRRSSERVLLAAWARAEWRRVAARRPRFAHLVGGADRWATLCLLASGAAAGESAAALR
eukprot:5158411-Alexandrium_andersonii.AAC.1